MNLSVVINTFNEEENLPKVLDSVKYWADEVVVVDMNSDDDTQKIAKAAGAKVYKHKRMGYVEPARNYAISKAKGDWILILDADELVSKKLLETLAEIAIAKQYNYVFIPRKNIIFNKWIQHSRWWPDYNIRFFKKNSVTWQDDIHSIPLTTGHGTELDPQEDLAIEHHHYQTISQYLNRLNRYTDYQVPLVRNKGYQFSWHHLISKPANEFYSRYFSGEGYLDGTHGLALALLQTFSELVLYLKIWEAQHFPQQRIPDEAFEQETRQVTKDLFWWLADRSKKVGETGNSVWWNIKRKLL
jgi:(heptosyl)LPS beta-1,4-glucosyltransferase